MTSAQPAALGLGLGVVVGTVLALVVRPVPGRRGPHRRADPDQALDPDAGADPAADPVARHRRADEGHHHRAGRLRADLHPHPQRPAQHRRAVRRAGRDRSASAAASSSATSCCPARCPASCSGMRFAVTVVAAALVVVEQYQRHQRHRLHDDARANYGQTDIIVVGLVVYALLGLLSDARGPPHREEGAVMATHAGELSTAGGARRSGSATCTAASTRPEACSTASTSTSRPASSWRCSGRSGSRQEHAAAGARRARPRRRRHRPDRACPTRCRWSSRTPGCCRGSGSSTTSCSACAAGDARERGRRGARRGRPRRPREGLAARAVRRRAAARRAGPLAGPRARSCCWPTSRSARWTR